MDEFQPFWAHSASDGQPPPDGWQPLSDHLLNVAQLARRFAQIAKPDDPVFSAQAYWAGLLHDLGKYSDAFQRMLQDAAQGKPKKLVEHSGHGAALAAEFQAFEAGFAVAGHHAGLPDDEIL